MAVVQPHIEFSELPLLCLSDHPTYNPAGAGPHAAPAQTNWAPSQSTAPLLLYHPPASHCLCICLDVKGPALQNLLALHTGDHQHHLL